MASSLRLFISSMMLIACPAVAQDSLPPDAASCMAMAGHADQRECLEARAKIRDEQIATYEHHIQVAIQHWDEDYDYRAKTRLFFDSARQAWSSSRSATCELVASTAAGGNGAGDLRLQCQEKWDLIWLAQLADLAQRLKPTQVDKLPVGVMHQL